MDDDEPELQCNEHGCDYEACPPSGCRFRPSYSSATPRLKLLHHPAGDLIEDEHTPRQVKAKPYTGPIDYV